MASVVAYSGVWGYTSSGVQGQSPGQGIMGALPSPQRFPDQVFENNFKSKWTVLRSGFDYLTFNAFRYLSITAYLLYSW